MHKDPFVFAQLVQFMDRSKFNRIVAKYEGDKYVKSFSCWNQLLTMMFGQLTRRIFATCSTKRISTMSKFSMVQVNRIYLIFNPIHF